MSVRGNLSSCKSGPAAVFYQNIAQMQTLLLFFNHLWIVDETKATVLQTGMIDRHSLPIKCCTVWCLLG